MEAKKYEFMLGGARADADTSERILNILRGGGKCPVKITLAKTATGVMAFAEEVSPESCLGTLRSADGMPVLLRKAVKTMRGIDLTEEGFLFDENTRLCMNDYTAEPGLSRDGELMLRVQLNLLTEKKDAAAANSIDEFTDIIRELSASGISSETLVQHDIEIMLANRFPANLIREVLYCQLRAGHTEEPFYSGSYYVPSGKEDSYLKQAAEDLLEGFGVIFSGGQSTGKTKAAMTLADIFNRPIIIETASASKSWQEMVAPKTTDNSASAMLDPEGAKDYLMFRQTGNRAFLNGASDFAYQQAAAASTRVITEVTPLVRAMQSGAIYCMDEMNCADPNVLESILNPILDNTRYLLIPGIGKVEIHKDFRFIGTQNPGFAGTMDQNQATLSRAGIINVPYGKSAKAQLMQALKPLTSDGYKVDGTLLNQIDKLYTEIVRAYTDRIIGDQCISIRGFARAITVSIKYGEPIKSAVIRHVISHALPKDAAALQAKLSLLDL